MAFKKLEINSIDDLIRCISIASLLELAGWPKPGNVHRTRNYDSTKYEHFIFGIAAIQPNFRAFCNRISNHLEKSYNNFSFVNLGDFYIEAAYDMMRWQKGGNVILGHILILAPLVAAATICLKTNKILFTDFTNVLNNVIENASVEDTIKLYKAIKICSPGGLGSVKKYDINNENALNEIRNDKVTLKQIFEFSKGYDLISYEYATNYEIILREALPFYFQVFEKYNNINIATVNTYLKILSDHPDTLIIRKSGIESASTISNAAVKILEVGGIASKKGRKLTNILDEELHKERGKLNPGTTADLIAGVLFSALIMGLKI